MYLSFLTSNWYRQFPLNYWLFKARIYGLFLRLIGFIHVEKGVGPIFVDPNLSLVVEKGSAIILQKTVHNLKDPFIAKYPKGVFIGGMPPWQFLNPPVSKKTTIRLKKNSKLIIGPNVLICKGSYLSVWPSQHLVFESNNYLGHENYINTKMGLMISDNTMTGHKVTIMDYDGHPIVKVNNVESYISSNENYGGKCVRVEIGKNVWIGFETTILKGAKIGKGAIIGAKSVVTDTRNQDSISAGNPAKTIKEGVTWQKF